MNAVPNLKVRSSFSRPSTRVFFLVGQLKPSGSPHDVLPPRSFKHVFEVIGPTVQKSMNSCLETATGPEDMRHAIVHPLLTKPNLDLAVLTYFRPVSNLSLISTILEKTVFHQPPTRFFKFRSGFRKTTPQVLNDIVLTRHWQVCSVLCV